MESVQQFILNLFISLRRHESGQLFYHFTSAIDTENIRVVFNAVKKTILKKNLENLMLQWECGFRRRWTEDGHIFVLWMMKPLNILCIHHKHNSFYSLTWDKKILISVYIRFVSILILIFYRQIWFNFYHKFASRYKMHYIRYSAHFASLTHNASQQSLVFIDTKLARKEKHYISMFLLLFTTTNNWEYLI